MQYVHLFKKSYSPFEHGCDSAESKLLVDLGSTSPSDSPDTRTAESYIGKHNDSSNVVSSEDEAYVVSLQRSSLPKRLPRVSFAGESVVNYRRRQKCTKLHVFLCNSQTQRSFTSISRWLVAGSAPCE